MLVSHEATEAQVIVLAVEAADQALLISLCKEMLARSPVITKLNLTYRGSIRYT